MSDRLERRIIEVAQQIIARAEDRAAAIHAEFRQLKAEKAARKAQAYSAKKGELSAAKLSLKRTRNFQMRDGSHYQCPSCWVDQGKRSALRGLRATANEDVFGCGLCGLVISTVIG